MIETHDCTFPQCGRPAHARGLCATHYRQRREGKPLTASVKKTLRNRIVPAGSDFRLEFLSVDADVLGSTLISSCDVARVAATRWHPGRGGYVIESRTHKSLAGFILSADLVDHVNGDIRDNRRENLRAVTPQQNAENRRPSRNNPLGFRNVIRRPDGRYSVRLMKRGKLYHGGRIFDNLGDAANAARALRARVYTHAVEARCTRTDPP